MRSVKARFNRIVEENPSLSSITCFFRAVESQNFKPAVVRKYFLELVDKSDYERKDKEELIEYAITLTEQDNGSLN